MALAACPSRGGLRRCLQPGALVVPICAVPMRGAAAGLTALEAAVHESGHAMSGLPARKCDIPSPLRGGSARSVAGLSFLTAYVDSL